MSKIVAIGGGEIGRPGFPIETTKIDKEIIRLSGRKKPNVLFLPTASSDSESYFEVFQKHYGKRLGCEVDVLYLIKENPSKKQIEEKIFSSHIIYVGGGNTLKMLKIWRNYGLDKILEKAYKKDIVLAGVSAGSICWFNRGISDSRKMINPEADYIKVNALGFISALHCPHYDAEKERRPGLKKMMQKTSGVAIAVENCCAVEFIDDKYRVISSKQNANAYKVYWKSQEFHEEMINKTKEFTDINRLLSK